MADRRPLVELDPDVEKILYSIAFLLRESDAVGYSPTQYDIVKSIFIADRSHLNEWGRPVTYDNYVAMEHGPVPSLAYDILKENTYAMKRYNINEIPWSREQVAEKIFAFHLRERFDFEEVLSESDMEALRTGLTSVRKLGFSQIKKLTHEDPAYIEAWNNRNGESSSQMSLGLLFDEQNFDEAERISEYSHYVHSR